MKLFLFDLLAVLVFLCCFHALNCRMEGKPTLWEFSIQWAETHLKADVNERPWGIL